MSRTISPNDLKGLLDTSKNLTVLDVRRKQDYDTDTLRLPGACLARSGAIRINLQSGATGCLRTRRSCCIACVVDRSATRCWMRSSRAA